MIRLATAKDTDGIIRLWNEAFGDTEEEIRFFLDNCFKEENTLIYEISGEIASMLFLLDGDMSVNNTDYPSYYLYAACTLKKHRGKGLMAELLSYAKTVACERRKYFICLRPGEESLFDFYEKQGYKTVFYIKKAEYCAADLINNISSDITDTVCDRENARNNAFSGTPFFKWDKHSIDYAFAHNEFFGGNAKENCKGYSLYTAIGDSLCVKETTFTNAFSVFSHADINLFCNSNRVIVNYPPYDYIDGVIKPYGMLLSVNNNSKKILNSFNCAYLGLTLE